MKHVPSCSSGWDDRESCFHHCRGTGEASASLFMCAKELITPPRRCWEALVGLSSAREDRESSFHRCRCPVRLVQAC